MESVKFTDPVSGESDSFFVVEKTSLNGREFLLVTEEEEGDSMAMILEAVSPGEGEDTDYRVVDDDDTLEAVSRVFTELLEDTEVTFES